MGLYDKKIPGYIFDRGAAHFNVKHPDFGAKGDGVTNDTAAIKAAAAAASAAGGGTLFFPEGVYLISVYDREDTNVITLDDYVSMAGAGYNTVITPVVTQMEGAANASRIWKMIRFRSHLSVRNMRFYGKSDLLNRTSLTASTVVPLEPWGAQSNYIVENVWIHHVHGINREAFGLNSKPGCHTFRYLNLTGYNVEGTPFHVTGNIETTGDAFAGSNMAHNVEVRGCKGYNNTWQGISVYGAYDVRISDCHFYGNSAHGLNLEWCYDVDVRDCVMSGNGYAGFGTWGRLKKVYVHDCTIYSNNPGLDRGEVQIRPGAWYEGSPKPDAGPEEIYFYNCVIKPLSGGVHFMTRMGEAINQVASVPLKVVFDSYDSHTYTSRGEFSSARDGLCVQYEGWAPVERVPVGDLQHWTIAGAITNTAYASGGNESSGARTLATANQFANVLCANTLKANRRYRIRTRVKVVDTNAAWIIKVADVDNADITGAYINIPSTTIDVGQWFTFDLMVTTLTKNCHIKFIRDTATGTSSSLVVDYVRVDETPSNAAHDPKVFELDAKGWGAMGDGTTNDYNAIHKAATFLNTVGGGTLYFPEGTYVINTQWDVPPNVNVRLHDKATIRAGAAMTRMLTVGLNTLTTGAIISGGTWDCNDLAQTGFHVFLVDDIVIENMTILDPTIGYHIQVGSPSASDAAHRGHIRGIVARRTSGSAIQSGGGCIHANECVGLKISDCDLEGGETGIAISGTSPDCIISDIRVARGATLTGNMTRGLYIGAKGCKVSNLHAEAPSEAGVYVNNHQFTLSNINVTDGGYGSDNVAAGVKLASAFAGALWGLSVTGDASRRFLYDVQGDYTNVILSGTRTENTTNVVADHFRVVTLSAGGTLTGQFQFNGASVWNLTGNDAKILDFSEVTDSAGGATAITTRGPVVLSNDAQRQQIRFRRSGTGEAGTGGIAFGDYDNNDFLIHRLDTDNLLFDFFNYVPATDTRTTAMKLNKDGYLTIPKAFRMDGPSGDAEKAVQFMTNGNYRWIIRTGSAAESGSNAGSPLEISRRADDGSSLGLTMSVARDTGVITMNDAAIVIGGSYTKPLYYGSYAVWMDTSGILRQKNGTPANATDGTPVGSGGAGATALGDLTDVTITTPATGNVLRYNGSEWVNAVLAYSDLSGTSDVALKSASNVFLGATQKVQVASARLWLGLDTTGSSYDAVIGTTPWGNGWYLGGNAYYSGSNEPTTNMLYSTDAGGSNTGAGIMRWDGNSKRWSFWVAPTSTGRGNAATMTEVMRWDSVGSTAKTAFISEGLVTLTRSGADVQIMRFNTERPWNFWQRSTGATTALALAPEGDSKSFIIQANNGSGMYSDQFIFVTTGSTPANCSFEIVAGSFKMGSSTIITSGKVLQNVTLSGTLIDNTSIAVGKINATGTPDGTKFLRGDGVWFAGTTVTATDTVTGTVKTDVTEADPVVYTKASVDTLFSNHTSDTTSVHGISDTALIPLLASSGGTAGDMLYYASSAWQKRAIGANNTVLTSDGSAPQWSTSLALAGTLSVTGLLTASGQMVMDNALQDKISLLENRLGLTTMYGFGVEGSTLYYKSASIHRWYVGANADGGTSDKMELTSTALTIGVPTVTVAGTYFASNGSTSATFDSRTTGDASYRWRMRADGSHLYGDGTSNLFTWSIVPISGLTPVGTIFGASGRFTRLGVGIGAQENYGIHMSLNTTGASSSRHGFLFEVGATYDAAMGTTGTVRGGWIRVNVGEDASLTQLTELAGLRIGTPTKGASLVTIDAQYGLRIDAQTLIAATPALAIYQVGTSDWVRFDGYVAQGANPSNDIGAFFGKTLAGSGATQHGVFMTPTFSASGGITNAQALTVRAGIPSVAATYASTAGIRIATATKGALATATTVYGLYLEDQTVGGTNWNLYVAGSAAGNYIAGRLAVGLNSQTTSAVLSVRGSVQTLTNAQIGIVVNPTFDPSVATSTIDGVQFRWTSSSTVATTTNTYVVRILAPSKHANHTVTTSYGMYMGDQSGIGATSYSIFVDGTAQSFFGGNVGIGTAAGTGVVFRVQRTLVDTSTATQYGVFSDSTAGSVSSGGASFRAGYFRANIPNVAGASWDAHGIRIAAATKGASATVATAYGLVIEAQTIGTTNYTLYTTGGLSKLLGTVLVGVDATPHASVLLQVEGTTGFFRPPVMTTTQRNAVNGGTFTDGANLYDSTLNRVTYRVNGAWQTVVTQEANNAYTGQNNYSGSINFGLTGVSFGTAPGNAGYYICSPTGTAGSTGYYITVDAAGAMQFASDVSTDSIIFGNDSSLTVPGSAVVGGALDVGGVSALVGNVVIGPTGAALATSATAGFLMLSNMAGSPTGNPSAATGKTPVTVDTTNLRLYFNTTGSTWRYIPIQEKNHLRITSDASAIAAGTTPTAITTSLQQAVATDEEWDIEWIIDYTTSVATDVIIVNVNSSAGTMTGTYSVEGATGVPDTGAATTKQIVLNTGTALAASANCPGNLGSTTKKGRLIVRATFKQTTAGGNAQLLLRAVTSAGASSGTLTVKTQSQMIATRIA
jgi:hypothetical protein